LLGAQPRERDHQSGGRERCGDLGSSHNELRFAINESCSRLVAVNSLDGDVGHDADRNAAGTVNAGGIAPPEPRSVSLPSWPESSKETIALHRAVESS
jgi:hypothetical protein